MQPQLESPFIVTPLPGFTPVIGHLVSMMTYARNTTLSAVEGLGTAQLDHLIDDDANSIGMLLEHIACIERGYQENSFGLPFEDDEADAWRLGHDLGADAREHIRGNGLPHYLDRLTTLRNQTLEELARRDDDWLFEESSWWGGHRTNNYFKWFHVLEDEINHRGQIRVIRKRLPEFRPDSR